jgi:hypothetical protein
MELSADDGYRQLLEQMSDTYTRRQKDELLVEYATYGMSSQLFVQTYQLYLPDREALRQELELTLREAGQ